MRALLLAATLAILVASPTAAARPPDVAATEIDLTWMNSCPGPWGHEERTTVGPVTIVQYVCDDGGA